MATYSDLKTRIAREMVRDDLLDDPATASLLATHIRDAIEEFADMRFWFNQSVQSVVTTSGVQSVAVPAPMRIVDRVAGPYCDLTPVILREITDAGDLPRSGYPTSYTYLDEALRLDPVPDAAYELTLYGIAQIDAPSADGDSSVWTNEAQALIAAQTRLTLYRDLIFDDGRAALAALAAQTHLAKLRRETDRRLRTRLAARLVAPNGQSVRKAFLDRL